MLEKVKVSEGREVHVQVNEYKGRRELDIRTFIISSSYTGYSPKGIRLPIQLGKKIAEAILKVVRAEGAR